jgi:hypothetical protein
MAGDRFHGELLKITLRLPGAHEDRPWGSVHRKVDGKTFVGWGRLDDADMSVGLRVDTAFQSMLVANAPRFSIAKYLGIDTDTSIWYAEAISDYSMPYDGVLIEVTPAGVSPPGTRWGLTFNSWASRTPLLPGFTYDGSQFLGDSTIGYLATCAAATGSFRVDTFTGTPLDGGLGGVTDFTAAFSFGCEGSAGALSGCVHYASN